jgi:tryptophanyl-tRNA synthetase
MDNPVRKRVFSGIQPTSVMHIGNYFGAVQNWVKLQDSYECIYSVVDLHAMTIPYQPEQLFRNTREMLIDLLACGVDPERSIVFIQSMVPEHMELAWVFNCVTSYGELTRMTQFKDKTDQLRAGDKDALISAGLFNYPILQAADILVYKAEFVPVGKDQEQHLELSRNIAERFNFQYGEYFVPPQPLFTDLPKLLSLADPTKKMSKSLGPKHFIALFEEEDVVRKKVMSAVTDSGQAAEGMSPGVANLIEILKACGKLEAMAHFTEQYNLGGLRYKDLKESVADALVELISGFREKRKEILSNKDQVKRLENEMAEKARAIAFQVMREVRERTGMHKYGRING